MGRLSAPAEPSGVKALLFGFASDRQQKLLYGVIAGIVAVLWLLHSRAPIVFPVDDAYITAHNADVIASGSDTNFGVSGLTGATSPFHTLLTALFAVVLPGATALYVVMWLGALAYVLGVVRLAFVFGASLAQAALLALVAALVAEVPHQLMNGLETGWVLAGIVWTLAFASGGLARGRVTAALCGLLPALRPELAAVSGLILGVQALRRWRSRTSPGAALRAIAIDAAVAAAVLAPFVIALWIATGSPVPGTIHAKRQFFAESCLPAEIRRSWVVHSLREMIGLLGVLAAAAILLLLTGLGRAGVLFIIILILAYYLQFPGALAHYDHRYLYPVVPFLVYGVASCLRDARQAVRWINSSILIATAVLATAMAPAAWRRHTSHIEFTVNELDVVAAWARDHLPASAPILIHDAGYIAYATDLRLVDMVGLKTPASASAHARWTLPSCGRKRHQAIHDIALASNAKYLIVLNEWDRLFGLVPSLAHHGWKGRLVRPVPGRKGYVIYEITPPQAP